MVYFNELGTMRLPAVWAGRVIQKTNHRKVTLIPTEALIEGPMMTSRPKKKKEK